MPVARRSLRLRLREAGGCRRSIVSQARRLVPPVCTGTVRPSRRRVVPFVIPSPVTSNCDQGLVCLRELHQPVGDCGLLLKWEEIIARVQRVNQLSAQGILGMGVVPGADDAGVLGNLDDDVLGHIDDVDLDLIRQFIVRRELSFKYAVEASHQWVVVDAICTLLVFRERSATTQFRGCLHSPAKRGPEQVFRATAHRGDWAVAREAVNSPRWRSPIHRGGGRISGEAPHEVCTSREENKSHLIVPQFIRRFSLFEEFDG